MADFIIAPDTGGSITFKQLVANAQAFADRYWLRVPLASPEFRKEMIRAPATNGSKVKYHGFEGQDVEVLVVYIGLEAAVRTARDTDEIAFGNDNLSITIPDGPVFAACQFMSGRHVKGPRKSETVNYIYQVSYLFRVMRLE